VDKQDTKSLKKRYLIWLYKTTKEALDRIDRKFTQLEIDSFILKELKKLDKSGKAKKFIDEFESYIQNKAKDGLLLKFGEDKELKPDYHFLVIKLKAVEKAITAGFGKNFLDEVKMLYEVEMTERILKSRDH
jgi:hypothetical protein